MIGLLLALSLGPGAAGAQEPPPAVEGRPVEPLPVTGELLLRWGVEPERYRELEPGRKRELQEQLTRLELGRLRRLEILRSLRAEDWRGFVDARGLLTPEGERLVDEHLARQRSAPLAVPAQLELERRDGQALTEEDLARARVVLDRMFDKVQALQQRGEKPPPRIDWDARFRNGTLYSLTATNPENGVSLEIGQLGVDGRSALLAPSWYGNLTKHWESRPESWVDYRVRAQIGYVDLRARFFHDGPDPRVDRSIQLMRELGLSDERAARLSQYVRYDDAYKAQGIVAASLMTELGRAYNLFGPVDVSWTVGNLTKIIHLAPNTAFDETLGLRVRLKDNLFVGVFGGLTQNVSMVSNRLLQETFAGGIEPGLRVENAPHATLAFWGQVPGVSDLKFSASAGARFNRDTTVHQGELALTTSLRDRPLSLRGMMSRESGPEIEFERRKLRGQLDYEFADGARGYLAVERERVRFGNAELDSDSFLAGFEILLGGSGNRNAVSVEQLFGGRYEGGHPLGPEMPALLSRINRAMGQGLDAASRARELYEGLRAGTLSRPELERAIAELSHALQRLDPELGLALVDRLGERLSPEHRELLAGLFLRGAAEGSEAVRRLQEALAALDPARLSGQADEALKPVDDAMALFARHEGRLRELAGLLGDPGVWEAALVQAGRAALLKTLDKGRTVNIPLVNREIELKLTAPVALAAGNILQSRLSPVAPVKKGEIEPWLLREASEALGLGSLADEEQIAQRLFAMAGAEIRSALATRLAPRLDPILQDLSRYDPREAARQVLAALPPSLAQRLEQRYGSDLAGLLPAAGLDPQRVREALDRLPDRLLAFLEAEYGGQIARALADMSSWAAELMRREINMTLIHLLLASEELNRLTVDKGLKISDWNVRMAMASFDKLDRRSRGELPSRFRAAARRVSEEAVVDEERLGRRFQTYGKARLEALQLDPAWPRGLAVEIPDESWLPLLTLYGDGPVFALLERVKGEYRPAAGPLKVVLEFDEPRSLMGTAIRKSRRPSPELRYTLGRPKDARQAEFRLNRLESYVPDAQAPERAAPAAK